MCFAAIWPDANAPLFATTWWGTVSVFFHVTLSPPSMVHVFGVNAVDVMLTVLFAARPAKAKPATPSAHAAVASARAFFMLAVPPKSFDGYVWNGLNVQKLRT